MHLIIGEEHGADQGLETDVGVANVTNLTDAAAQKVLDKVAGVNTLENSLPKGTLSSILICYMLFIKCLLAC